jgi:hypothetical protein
MLTMALQEKLLKNFLKQVMVLKGIFSIVDK